jgi:hypothetical protein
MIKIDLEDLTRGEVPSLIGYARGERARRHFRLAEFDLQDEPVTITAPSNLRTLTPSFVQGFLGDSLLGLGEAKFRQHYLFVGFGETARVSLEAGFNRILLDRSTLDRSTLERVA